MIGEGFNLQFGCKDRSPMHCRVRVGGVDGNGSMGGSWYQKGKGNMQV